MSLFGYWLVPRRDVDALTRQLDRIESVSRATYGKVWTMALDLTALRDAVAADTAVDTSAITLLNGLTAKIQELIDNSQNTVDPAELQGIVDAIKGTTDGLAAAVQANTPAEPTP